MRRHGKNDSEGTGRVRAALRRTVTIAVRAAWHIESPSLGRRVMLSDIWDSLQYEGGRRHLISEQWQAAEIAEKQAQG